MIYSVAHQKEIPVVVTKKINPIYDEIGDEIVYTVHDASNSRNHIGYVKLYDTKNGVKVNWIKNQNPSLYKHFGQIADQIELEHCLNRQIDKPYIQSAAAAGTHILHYLRGKRFINEGINIYLEHLINNQSKGKRITTGFLGYQKMYMPINLINEIKEKIRINPLLKGIK